MRHSGFDALFRVIADMENAVEIGALPESAQPYIERCEAAALQCCGDATRDAADWCTALRRLERSVKSHGLRLDPALASWLAANQAHIDQMQALLADAEVKSDGE